MRLIGQIFVNDAAVAAVQLAADQAAVDAAKAKLLSDTTLLGVTGTLDVAAVKMTISSTLTVDPVFIALGLDDVNFLWLAPNGTWFTGKAPAGANFVTGGVGTYRVYCTNWSAVTEFNCNNDNVTVLDVAAAAALTALYIYGNTAMINPPNLTTNTALTTLFLYSNTAMITPPDLTTNTALTALDLSGCTAMTTPPDLTTNTALTTFNMNGCTSLDAADLFDLFGDLTTAALTGCVINVSSIVAPDAATMALIYNLAQAGCTITCDAPAHVHGTAETVEGIAAQQYDYTTTTGSYVGAVDAATIYHDGSTWVLVKGVHAPWVGPAASITGNYVLAGHDTVIVS